MNLKEMRTEKQNPRSIDLDIMSVREALELINGEDAEVLNAVENELPDIEKAVEVVTKSLKEGGRLIYIGAGTSGRLGILDAAECPPTFGVDESKIKAIIAGGEKALVNAIEGAEDDDEQGRTDLEAEDVCEHDTVIGLSASGRTPYVKGALVYAMSKRARTVGITCNKQSSIGSTADIAIELDTGPEVLTGSTRMKAGTAQKMVLNMISTMAMVGIGKVYKHYMVDLQVTNEKLKRRAENIVAQVTDVSLEKAKMVLERSSGNVKIAIVSILKNCTHDEAQKLLEESDGVISAIPELEE